MGSDLDRTIEQLNTLMSESEVKVLCSKAMEILAEERNALRITAPITESPISNLRLRNKRWMEALIDSLDTSIAVVREHRLADTNARDLAEAEFEDRDMVAIKAFESMVAKTLVMDEAKREVQGTEVTFNKAKQMSGMSAEMEARDRAWVSMGAVEIKG